MNAFEFCTGVVVASTGAARCYIVAIPGATLEAQLVTDASEQLGQIEHRALLPGTPVLCARFGALGYIIGALPAGVADAADRLNQISISGDSVGDLLGPMAEIRKVFTDRAQLDSMATDLLPGESGSINSFGVGLLKSFFYATMQAAPDVSVTVNLLDRLVRVIGQAVEYYSCGTAEIVRPCGDTVVIIRGEAPSCGEAAGAPSGSKAFKDRDAKTIDDDLKGSIDTSVEQQEPIFRLQEHGGAAGSLRATRVVAPAANQPVGQTDNATRFIGLSEQLIGDDGRIIFQSARGFAVIKRPDIPIPQAIADLRTETAADVEAVEKPAELSATDGLTFFARIKHALVAIYRHYYVEHAKRWKVPGGADALKAMKLTAANTPAADLAALVSDKQLEQPATTTLRVGGRDIVVYAGEAIMALTDDGCLYLQDCRGVTVQSCGGNLYASAPGDVSLRAGRDISLLAGRDVIAKAGGNAEVSSTAGAVRLKAEKEMALLGGNSGVGGVLIESRASGSTMRYTDAVGDRVAGSGVTLLARDSHVTALSPNIALEAVKLGNTAAGPLSLRSESAMLLQAQSLGVRVDNGAYVSLSNYATKFAFQSNGLSIAGAGITVEKDAYVVDGGLLVNGSIVGKSVAHDGKDATMLAGADGVVRRSMTAINANLDTVRTAALAAADAVSSVVDTLPPLSAETKKSIGFSFRADDEYAAVGPDPAMPWQTALAAAGSWLEAPVTAPTGATTYPAPGSTWNSEALALPAVDGLIGADGTVNAASALDGVKVVVKNSAYISLTNIGAR